MNEIDRRSQRLNNRIKKQKDYVISYYEDDKKRKNDKRSNTATKKSRSVDHQTTELGREKEVSRNFVDDELENDALDEMNESEKVWQDSQYENDIDGMTITHPKKDEVSVLSAPTKSTGRSLDDSVLNSLGPLVASAWKQQTKGMLRIFGPVVRDEFMPNYKFCNEKICEQIVTKCMARNEIVQTPGMTYNQFVSVTSRSSLVSKHFNSQRHHIQTKMRITYIGEKFEVIVE